MLSQCDKNEKIVAVIHVKTASPYLIKKYGERKAYMIMFDRLMADFNAKRASKWGFVTKPNN